MVGLRREVSDVGDGSRRRAASGAGVCCGLATIFGATVATIAHNGGHVNSHCVGAVRHSSNRSVYLVGKSVRLNSFFLLLSGFIPPLDT